MNTIWHAEWTTATPDLHKIIPLLFVLVNDTLKPTPNNHRRKEQAPKQRSQLNITPRNTIQPRTTRSAAVLAAVLVERQRPVAASAAQVHAAAAERKFALGLRARLALLQRVSVTTHDEVFHDHQALDHVAQEA
jgi:hypothetical protein